MTDRSGKDRNKDVLQPTDQPEFKMIFNPMDWRDLPPVDPALYRRIRIIPFESKFVRKPTQQN